MKKIFIVAGDKSGDLYGGYLCKKLKDKYGNLEIYSFGGSCLAQYSLQLVNLISHSVSGIYEVIFSLKNLIHILNQAYREIQRIKPHLIILIDFPDFNLRLAKKINRRIPVFYYVSPQLWAWRTKRVEIIKQYVDKMIVIFHFEKEFYKQKGIDALYFGHPLLEIIKNHDIPVKKNIISFMPGSRKNEIKHHLPVMEKTKEILKKEISGYSYRIIKTENITETFYHRYSRMPLEPHSYRAIGESKFIVTSSGTATIEIAIMGVPYIIIYKLNPISWQILKRIVKTEFAGMVNILAQEKIVDELLQNKATPSHISKRILYYLNNDSCYQEISNKLKKIQERLSPYGATDRFASYIGNYLNMEENETKRK